MCGIAGAIAFTEKGKAYLDKIGGAVNALRHRGPDGEGIYRDGNVALGHARLAIIDTTEAGAQPFTSADGRYTIVLNGEIFNFRELRAELEKDGVKFRSQTDTEVLLAMYAKYGNECLPKLNGFFAFAVYDKKEQNLFLARDRFGEKPLYWYYDEDVSLFASEMKALVAFGIPQKLSEESLAAYLHLNYIPGNNTIFEHTWNHPVGFWNVMHSDRPFTGDTYYDITRAMHPASKLGYEEAQAKLRTLAEDAVVRRLVADVPLGAFLSGGVDSSIITALAAKHKPGMETFSVGFADEPYFDETQYAQLVANHLGTKHHVFSLTNNDLLESLHTFLENCDEPFADSSALAVNILSRETRKHVTVALSGDGADELFAGYNKHEGEYRARQKNLVNTIIKAGAPLWNFLHASRNTTFGNKVRQLRRFAAGLDNSPAGRYWLWAGYTSEGAVDRLYPGDKPREILRKEMSGGITGKGDLNEILRADMQMVLRGDMLVKVDRMSMLHGLEVRPPFLDHEVVDFVMSLPASYKIDDDSRKKILKDAFSDLLPAEIYERPKQGFEVPLLHWFRGELRGMIEEVLNEKFLREQNLFRPEIVKALRRQLHSPNPGESVARIWGLLVFQKWWLKYMRNAPRA